MKNLKQLNALIVLLCTLNMSSAKAINDACVEFNTASEAEKANYFSKLKKQHLVVHHSSVSQTTPSEYEGGQKAFYTELCKTPYHHRDSLRQHGIEIHLVAGSIDQHSHIQKTIKAGLKPRNHDEHTVSWGDLPGVGSDGYGSPLIIDLVTLSKPKSEQKHGSGSLVIHEFAHAIDFYFIKTGKKRNNISSTQTFKSVSKNFDWKVFIPDYELIESETFVQKGSYYVSNKNGLHISEDAKNEIVANIEKRNKHLSEINAQLEINRQYNAGNYEESFAEMYTKWYQDEASRNSIINGSQIAAKFFNNLESQRHEYNLVPEKAKYKTPEITAVQETLLEVEALQNIIEHESCELGWMDLKSKNLYAGSNGKMDHNNINTVNILNLLKDKGYSLNSNRFKNRDLILFSLKTHIKGEKSEGTVDQILHKGMSFINPSNKLLLSLSRGTLSNDILLEEQRSFRRESLATSADYIYNFVEQVLPHCEVK